MNFRSKIFFFCFFSICGIILTQAQSSSDNTLDSLLIKDYEYLEDKIFEHANDTVSANSYAHLYLKKARKNSNKRKEIDGYYLLSIINNRKKSLAYSDSALFYSKKYKIKDWLAPIFLNKGNLYDSNDEYNYALENYLLARKELDSKVQTNLYQMITANIAHIKSTIGKDKEALALYKEVLKTQHLNANPNNFEVANHLELLFGLSDSYKKNDKLDSASTYNTIGVVKSKKHQRELFYSKFVLNEATNLFKKKKYIAALDSINTAIPILEKSIDKVNLAIAYLYKGKILDVQKNKEESYLFYKKTDSIIGKKTIPLSYFIEVYEWLYRYYKKKDDLEKQLFYLEKLIAYNAKINTTYRDVNAKIQKEFDTPNLLREKETLIDELKSHNKSNSLKIVLLSIALGMFLIISFYYYRHRMIYKKRYEKLLIKNSMPEVTRNSISEANTSSLKIPDIVIESILSQLDNFEKQNTYLDGSITLNNLAKTFKTNANYLSKIINLNKDKNFSTYLSDLRISYSIKEIRTNSKLLNYKVKALANEFGFGNSESFTKAFYKKTGIYPSYYVKQLKKEET